MTDLMQDRRTTMSDVDVVTRPVGGPYDGGWLSDKDVIPASHPPVSSVSYPMERVRMLSGLRDNWDGHFALAPREDTIRRASDLLEVLLNAMPRSMPLPYVTPSTEGGVILEWSRTGTEVMVEIGPDDVGVYVEIEGESNEGSFASLESELRSALRRVADGS